MHNKKKQVKVSIVLLSSNIIVIIEYYDQRWTSILETSGAYWITFINSPEYWKRGCFWEGVQILKARARSFSEKLKSILAFGKPEPRFWDPSIINLQPNTWVFCILVKSTHDDLRILETQMYWKLYCGIVYNHMHIMIFAWSFKI